ncbi:MAG: tetratricopeptide repeat protein [Kofleriaceae bacterium]
MRAPASALLLGVLLASPAGAAPDEASREKARELTERAIEKGRANQHEAAIELYQRAYDLSGEAILLSNIGSAYQAIGRPERALIYYCRYLDEDPEGKLAAFARTQAEELAHALGNEDVCEQRVTRRSATRADDPDDGAASLKLNASDRPEPEPEPALGPALRYGGLAMIGGGVIALGVGGYYGWVGKQASDKITNNRDGWTDEILEQQRIGRDANDSMKMYMIGGGVAVLAGTALYVWGRSVRPEERRVAITPTWTPQSSGFALSGSFE